MKTRHAPAADESATRGVSPPCPGQGPRPLGTSTGTITFPSRSYSTTSTIYDAYDDGDEAASPGATAGCGGGVSTGLAADVGGKGGVAAGFFLKKDVSVRWPPLGLRSMATGSMPAGGSTLLCFLVPPKDTSL